MSFISYAQNFEDVMLWRALKHVDQGFYVDVGANDPIVDSVTKAFYDVGWRGINIEPEDQWFEKLVSDRPRDINLQCAAGSIEGDLEFYVIPNTGLSTLNLKIAEKHELEGGYTKQVKTVPVRTFTDICRQYCVNPIHFLKIDVEAAEKAVLEGLDLKIVRPWIIVVESTLPTTQEEDYDVWEPMLVAADYRFVYFDGLNRYYLAAEHQELSSAFNYPPNVFDDFAMFGVASHTFCNKLNEDKNLIEAENSSLKLEMKESLLVLSDSQAVIQKRDADLKAAEQNLKASLGEFAAAEKANSQLEQQLAKKSEQLATKDIAQAEYASVKNVLQQELDKANQHLNVLSGQFAAAETTTSQLEQQLAKKSEQLATKDIAQAEYASVKNVLQQELDQANQ